MSQPRNTPDAPRRPRHSKAWVGLAALALAGTAAACADAPSGPVTRDAPAASKGSASPQAQARVQRLSPAAFELLKQHWATHQKAVAAGKEKAEALRCEPTRREEASKRIGVKGGRLAVGPVTLDIPAGALAGDVTISASTRPGPFLEVEFAPHGLTFRKPVQLTFNYARCAASADTPLDVVYVGHGWQILETVPTTNRHAARQIAALTDHFSGYMVSMGRADREND